jgi:hypothetical protein
MKRLSLSMTALALSSALAVSSIVPAEAMPVVQPQVTQSSDVTNAKVILRKHHRHAPRISRGHRVSRHHHVWRGHHARGYRYWHGHRGYRYYRPGYRRYNGFWFPPAAFAAGVVIGATARHAGNAHVRWCRNHYISYRVSDNTYQPYHGPRRQCVSP